MKLRFSAIITLVATGVASSTANLDAVAKYNRTKAITRRPETTSDEPHDHKEKADPESLTVQMALVRGAEGGSAKVPHVPPDDTANLVAVFSHYRQTEAATYQIAAMASSYGIFYSGVPQS